MLAEPDEVKVCLPPEIRGLSNRRMALQRDWRRVSLLQVYMAGERRGQGREREREREKEKER